VEEDAEERHQNGLDHEHQQEIAGELAHVDRGFVSRRQAKRLPAVVLALDHEGAAEPEQPGQEEAEPQQSGQGAGQPFAVGPHGELEYEEEEKREEEERVERLLRPALDEKILPHYDERAPCEGQGASSVCTT